jgi:RNA 2',3'-cyclic 3'-phosphodiesterase
MPENEKAIRTFIAVEFSAKTRETLGGVTRRLALAGPERAVSWVKRELMHLTLKFLGETPTDALPKIVAALEGVAKGQTAFDVQTSGLGCFPNLKKPRVIWMGFEPEGMTRLSGLNRAVEGAVAPLGFPTETRPFSPHLTLGRVRKEVGAEQAARVGAAVRALADVPILNDSIGAVVLIKSELRSGGPLYTVLHTANFTGR